MSEIPHGKVWELARCFKEGEKVYLEYHFDGKKKVYKETGVVKRPAVDKAYASLKVPSVDYEIEFPQDGMNGTTLVHYLTVQIEEEMPKMSPFKREEPQQPQQTSANNTAQPEGLPAFLAELLANNAGNTGQNKVNLLTIEFILSPKDWHKVCTDDLSTFKAQLKVREYFAYLEKFASEAHIFEDIVSTICLNMEVVLQMPSITTVPQWIKSMETLIGRCYLQRERQRGTSAKTIDDMQRGFQQAYQPDFVKKALESAATFSKLRSTGGGTHHNNNNKK
jgi:hypothetical protein